MQGASKKPLEINEENYQQAQFSVPMPWQYAGTETVVRDADGIIIGSANTTNQLTRKELHTNIWKKFHNNPHVNTSVRGLVGRMCGNGFATLSDIPEIEAAIDETETDYRNRLYDYWPKFVTRAFISGELLLCFTVHEDGFIEIDFVDPDVVDGDFEEGILFHPTKTRMPLIYSLKVKDTNGIEQHIHIPSIYMARYPELWTLAKKQKGYSEQKLKGSKANGRRYKGYRNIGGYYQFIVSWDMGLMTNRSTSHLQTILQWLNIWENLKYYEVDHKKSSGAYVWVVQFTDVKSWITWLKLTDAEREKTGICAPKTPGGTMVLGPNMEMKAQQPQLPKISDSDTDIMHMVTGGLNEAEDVTTGQSKGTFASVKASRGPMSDRVSDEMAYFERWLRYDFWGNVFFLKTAMGKLKNTFKVKQAVGFDNKKKPIMKEIEKKPEKLIDIIFPVSAIENIESQAKAFLGVKHGSLVDTAGMPAEELLKKMGFRGYRKLRLQKATEDELYPETVMNVDQESNQELKEDEGKRNKSKKKQSDDSEDQEE